jgi:nucleoside phosphorylase
MLAPRTHSGREKVQNSTIQAGFQGDMLKPAVHFGIIASGNQVMKSGEDRDAIAKDTDAIAFEMEGAGVWDHFPCVVIKGVCDYSDSHKNYDWQIYSALTAASCMKAFLHEWSRQNPDGTM